jgi:hypothetical protein
MRKCSKLPRDKVGHRTHDRMESPFTANDVAKFFRRFRHSASRFLSQVRTRPVQSSSPHVLSDIRSTYTFRRVHFPRQRIKN